MIKRIFETNRPIFFISDRKEFGFWSDANEAFSLYDVPFSSTATTVSLFCLPVFDEGDSNFNEVSIYVNEHPTKDGVADYCPVFNGILNIPSKAIEISESDMFVIFEKSFDVDRVGLTVFIEKDYAGDAPSKFIVVINDTVGD